MKCSKFCAKILKITKIIKIFVMYLFLCRTVYIEDVTILLFRYFGEHCAPFSMFVSENIRI